MNTLLEDYGDLNIFIDCGYLNYYTIYGAFNMWKKSYPDRFKQRCPSSPQVENLPDLTNDDRFIMCMETKMQRNLDKIFNVVRTKVFGGYTPPGIQPKFYFVTDSRGVPYWRKTDLYPEYKMQRKLSKKYFNTSKAFGYLDSVIIPKMDIENFFGIKTLSVDRAEADDIIMTLIRYMKHTHNVIIATDHDYIQVLDKAKMFDLIGKEITVDSISEKLTKKPDIKVTTTEYLLSKFLMGDTSDNIPAIYDGCGPVTAYKLATNPAKLREKLLDNKQAPQRLKLNRKLIDCKQVPIDLQKEIIYEYSRSKA
jgi:5'-3' exonuclease